MRNVQSTKKTLKFGQLKMKAKTYCSPLTWVKHKFFCTPPYASVEQYTLCYSRVVMIRNQYSPIPLVISTAQ